MNKKIIGLICSIFALILLSIPVVTMGNVSANTAKGTLDNLVATTDSFAVANTKLNSSKNETVYLIGNSDGTIKNTFIGSTLYTGSNTLPFETKITYFLDGAEVSSADLLHKSGHVKIAYDYNATALYQGKKVPFVALTGLELDSTKFSNLKITSGKIIREGENYTIVGYSLLGLGENLGVDFLPSTFSIEADVHDFTLETSYSVLLNDIFADIDTSKLTGLDSLVSSINQLSDGMDQLVSGASQLSTGAKQLSDGTKELQTGVKALSDGISDVNDGGKELANGLSEITKNNTTLQTGATAIITSTLQSLNSNLTVQYVLAQMHVDAVTVENYTTIIETILKMGESAELTQAKALLDFSTGVIGYTKAVQTATTGATKLSAGLDQINTKMPELVAGTDKIAKGVSEIATGAAKLEDGTKQFKAQGIDRLVSFANRDLASFTWNFRQTVNAASSYKNYSNPSATSVKFIVKTASIK